MTSTVRLVRCPKCRKVLAEPQDVLVYECGGCNTKLQAKKRNNPIDDNTSQKPEDDSFGKRKVEQDSDDQEPGSSSNQQLLITSTEKPDQNSNRNNLDTSNNDQDSGNKLEIETADDESFQVKEYSAIQTKMKQLSDDEKVSSNLQIDHNDPRSSTELSGHDHDPQSSPEAVTRIDQEQEDEEEEDYYPNVTENRENVTADVSLVGLDHSSEKRKMDQLSDDFEIDQDLNDQEFLSCRKGTDFEESSSEFEETFVDTKILNSSFKSMIAEKLLDTRQKRAVNVNEDDILSEDRSADLRTRRRFDRVSSGESSENLRFGGPSYYGYEGSESSFDGNESSIPRKNRVNRRNEFHPSNARLGKSPLHGLNKFHASPRHRAPVIPENPKMERIELLKMVRELQDQLERTSVSNVGSRVSSYYNHILNNEGRYGPRMAFSGEQTGRRDGNLCHHCCPQDRRFSAQLPRQHVCSNGPHYGPGPNTYFNAFNPQFSGPSSPNLFSESEFSAPDDHRFTKPKPYRSPMKKRYVMPISGGSPWIACYKCSEILQLPQSFLVFKRTRHSLKCGSCFKILTFTLSNRTHITRYYPEETVAAPPSSEVEDYDKPVRARADPVSCSDRSFQKSSSSETDRNGSRKVAMVRDSSDSTRGRSEPISEIEEVRDGPNGSRLHWLMGYPSPSKVIRG